MKTFKDLEFKAKWEDHVSLVYPEWKTAEGAHIEFDNRYGVSVITGHGSYTDEASPYELAVLYEGELCYNTHITQDVVGWLTEDKVTELMKQIQEL